MTTRSDPAAAGDHDDNAAPVPQRQVRAVFDEASLTVYQAYSPAIADAALEAGRFVPPFQLTRMTWIKPSFLWMMYRSGWATKPGQERILAIEITRAGFERALTQSSLSHYHVAIHASHDVWLRSKHDSHVRVQWDPERSIYLEPLPWRSIQVGLGGPAVLDYIDQWIIQITDITPSVHELHELLQQGELGALNQRLPVAVERPYPLSDASARAIGASQPTRKDSPT
jgi:hypothetical protein